MKRLLAALAVVGAQPILAYVEPTPEVPACSASPAASEPSAEPKPSAATDKSPKASTPAAPTKSAQKEHAFHGMSKSIIQNIRARTANPASASGEAAPSCVHTPAS